MRCRIYLSYLFLLAPVVFADIKPSPTKETESQILSNYEGVTGTAPVNQTVSSAGVAFDLLPNGTNYYGFFSQTLSNDLYYEVRAYARYNYQTNDPNIPGIPRSNATLPIGYGFAGFLGYNFHPNENVDITPYLRINAYNNMGPVYEDVQGDYLTSNTFAALAGGKLVFKVSSIFAPYVNIWGGYQTNNLTGAYPNSATQSSSPVTGVLNQFAMTYEIGMAAKLTKQIVLIPYMGYITTFNYPDQTAQTAIDQGGLNQSNLPGTSQYFGLKLGVAW